jgi:hypothetical protein
MRVRVEVPSRSGLMFRLSPQRHGTLNIADKVSATVPEIAVASLGDQSKSRGKVPWRALDCGHFLQEERPQDVLMELSQFLS